ncbi:MAG: gliding motility-associated C-terminal domain-containing protein [Saprospiraceae bacterium]|nr:gliding motility-associated C-terminal domain-containing protein [Saprospiraceae bacterium]
MRNTLLSETVTISYCKDVPGSQEIKFTQDHNYKTKNCFEAKFPNVVSINSEIPENKVFKHFCRCNIDRVLVSTFNLKVYNRWGKKVYETSKVDDAWDLQYKNQPAAIDTYIYVCEIKNLE